LFELSNRTLLVAFFIAKKKANGSDVDTEEVRLKGSKDRIRRV
jgi:hypothetical protein